MERETLVGEPAVLLAVVVVALVAISCWRGHLDGGTVFIFGAGFAGAMIGRGLRYRRLDRQR